MKKIALAGAALLALMAFVRSADAAVYNFDVLYDGTTATLASGSDDPLATTRVAGDSFTYTLSATGTGEWTKLTDNSLFPFLALETADAGDRTGDIVVTLNNHSSSVFSYSETGVDNQYAHLGSNSVTVGSGTVWNQWVLDYTKFAGDAFPIYSLLPFNSTGPENYFAGDIAFSGGAVPEPAAWALIIGGFGLTGAALRRRRAVAVAVAV